MGYAFSKSSLERLAACHKDLITLMTTAIKTSSIDFSIICGYRGEAEQNKHYENGTSKVKFPHGKHNSLPSLAVDIQPYPYTKADQYDNTHAKFRKLSEHIKKIAKELGIGVINGGLDWGWDWFHWEVKK